MVPFDFTDFLRDFAIFLVDGNGWVAVLATGIVVAFFAVVGVFQQEIR